MNLALALAPLRFGVEREKCNARMFLVYLDEKERNAKDEALNFFDVNIYVCSERLDRSESESQREREREE